MHALLHAAVLTSRCPGYLHKHLKETLGANSFTGLALFCNVAIVYKQKAKEAALRSHARARTSMERLQWLICWCVWTEHIQNCDQQQREPGHAPDGSCMSLPRGGAHTVYFDKLQRVRAINTSAAR